MRKYYTLGELFCGPGGLALGAKSASVKDNKIEYTIEHGWATDIDPNACETYRKNICPENPETVVCEDIKKINFERLAEKSQIDALSFGFPCNDFSMVGEKKGIDGTYGPLYKYAVKALDFFNPKWFLAENVGGLMKSNAGKAFDIILKEFGELGYDLFPHLYRFEKYGVPQARHRIIILGFKKDLRVDFKIPSSDYFRECNVSCRYAIENPPIKSNAPNHEFTNQSQTVIERLKHIKPGQNAFTAELPDNLRLRVKGARISQIYKRLDPDKPAYTITGSGGGGTHVYHWSENRALTNRERARLQTFPDDFIFVGSKENVRKQIGMAVPPKGAQIIFETILKSLFNLKYESMNSNIRENKDLFCADKHYVVNEVSNSVYG